MQFFTQYSLGNDGIIVQLPSAEEPKLKLPEPIIWARTATSILCRTPATFTIGIQPEDYLFMGGFNPLSFPGTAWNVQDSATTSVTLVGHIQEDYVNSDETIKLVLDPGHAFAISYMQISYANAPKMLYYRTSKFRAIGGTWIPEVVDVIGTSPGISSVKYRLSLSGVTNTTGFAVDIPNHQPVEDARLLGGGTSMRDLVAAWQQHSPEIVNFNWNGTLPPLSELQQLQTKQSPNQKSSSARINSGVLISLGILAVIIAIAIRTSTHFGSTT